MDITRILAESIVKNRYQKMSEGVYILNESRYSLDTPAQSYGSISTMLSATFHHLKMGKVSEYHAAQRVYFIMQQYLRTMRDKTWDTLRDEFTEGPKGKSIMAKFLKSKFQTVPNVKTQREMELLSRQWVAYAKMGGIEFAELLTSKPGMKRLKPNDKLKVNFDMVLDMIDPETGKNGRGELVDPSKGKGGTVPPTPSPNTPTSPTTGVVDGNSVVKAFRDDVAEMEPIIVSMLRFILKDGSEAIQREILAQGKNSSQYKLNTGNLLNSHALEDFQKLMTKITDEMAKGAGNIIRSKKW